jgi:thiamine phosphate synthase YjbQ (UPF0047 family)
MLLALCILNEPQHANILIVLQTPGRTQCTLCTSDIVRALPGLKHVKQGLALLSVRDPSASVTVNENADPSVRTDMDVCPCRSRFAVRTVPASTVKEPRPCSELR